MKIPPPLATLLVIATTLGACAKEPSAPLNTAQTVAADNMIRFAKSALQTLTNLESIEKLTPEVIERDVGMSRNLLNATLLRYPAGPERKAALEAHHVFTVQMLQATHRRLSIDGVQANIDMAEYYVAEAEFLLASEK